MTQEARRLHGTELPSETAPWPDAKRRERVERSLRLPATRIVLFGIGVVVWVTTCADHVENEFSPFGEKDWVVRGRHMWDCPGHVLSHEAHQVRRGSYDDLNPQRA